MTALFERKERTIEQALEILDVATEADSSERQGLLRLIGPALYDARVCESWLRLLSSEPDPHFKTQMLWRLQALNWQAQSGALAHTYLKALSEALDSGEVRLREVALRALTRWGSTRPEVEEILIQSYPRQSSAEVRDQIISILCQNNNLPPRTLVFFKAQLETDSSLSVVSKTLVYRQLFRLREFPTELSALLPSLLLPSEPAYLKVLTLKYLLDRPVLWATFQLDKAVLFLLEHDSDSQCRIWAIRWIGSQAGLTPLFSTTLLKTACNDPEPRVQAEALSILESRVDPKSSESTEMWLTLLKETKAAVQLRFCISLVRPFVTGSEPIRLALLNLAKERPEVQTAQLIYGCLAPGLKAEPQDIFLLTELLDAFDRETDERVKSVILSALSQAPSGNPATLQIFSEALRAKSALLREWAALALIKTPLYESNVPFISQLSTLLSDGFINRSLKLTIVQTLRMIPVLPRPALESVKLASEQADQSEVRLVCREIYDRSQRATPSGRIDWELRIRRVEIEKTIHGVFPDTYFDFQDAPPLAFRVIRSALLGELEGAMYSMGYSAEVSLEFLIARSLIDDAISRYCIHYLLDRDAISKMHLAALKSNPACAELREGLWRILERDADPVLLKDVFACAYGGESNFEAALEGHLIDHRHLEELPAYLKFLFANRNGFANTALLRPLAQGLVKLDTLRGQEVKAYLVLFHPEFLQAPAQATGGFRDE